MILEIKKFQLMACTEQDEREDQKRLLLCSQSSQMPSVSYPIMFDPRENYFMEQQLAEAKDQEQVSIDGSVDHPFNLSSSFSFMDEDHTNISPGETNTSVYDHRSSEQSKWMSSKMRLMKKMMNSNEDIGSNTMWVTVNSENQNQLQSSETENTNNPTNNGIRVCSDCNTTKTPLWRSGPQGPKSLCNACGIRQRKVRRAMIAANGGNPTVNTLMKTGTKWNHKMRKSDTRIATTPLKKRYKLQPDQAQDQNHFQDPTSNVSKNAAFHKVFPQEEKEAAILLMALSCGLVHG